MVFLTRRWPIPPPRVVYKWKKDESGSGCAFWLDSKLDIRGWYVHQTGYDVESELAKGDDGGWKLASHNTTHRYGTTIEEVKRELMEGKDG